MPTSEPRFPARFTPDGFGEDIARSTNAGAAAAEAARREYRQTGIPRSPLKPCDPEGRDGTRLPQCLKTYVPHPDGKWGMVFRAQLIDGRPRMDFLAFGARHQPRDSNALTVYHIADRRLHADEEPPSTNP